MCTVENVTQLPLNHLELVLIKKKKYKRKVKKKNNKNSLIHIFENPTEKIKMHVNRYLHL